jgi:Flp pilus assembly protein TadD
MVVFTRRARGALGALAASFVVACSGEPTNWLRTSGFNQVFAAPSEGEWPDSAAGAYLVGRFALDQGDVATAITNFEQALRADPENAELRRQVFGLKIAGGSYDREGARDLLRLDPAADEARLVLALEAAKSRSFETARRELDAVVGRGISAIIVPLLRAWTYHGEGRDEEARATLEREQRDDGFALLRTYHLAALNALDGKLDVARELLRPLVATEQVAPVRLVALLAWIEAKAGDRAAALELVSAQGEFFEDGFVFDRMIERLEAGELPEPPIRDADTGMADALLSLAAALQDQRLSAQSLLYARLATFMDPQSGDAWLVIARSLSTQGNAAEAARLLDEVPQRSPFKWSARLARAEALDSLERTEDAVAEFRAMARERPERIDSLIALGDLLRGDERYAEAEEAYSEAVARLPVLERPHWRLLYARGIAYERTQRWPEAEADFLKALELEPEQPFVLNYLGYSWVDQGLHLDRAKAMLHRAVELRSEDGYVVDSLGWAYFRLGEFDRAVEFLERAVELQPGDPVINDHLGDAYWRVGREREARFQWSRALTLEPEQDSVAEIERKLNNGLASFDPDRG